MRQEKRRAETLGSSLTHTRRRVAADPGRRRAVGSALAAGTGPTKAQQEAKKQMKTRLFALAVGAGLLGLTAFGARGLADATGEPIAIGVIANLTGTDVQSSTEMGHGAEL